MLSSSSKPNVSIFATCVVNHIYPEVGLSTARVLEHFSCKVSVERNQSCCGQPFFNSGFRNEARKLAEKIIETYKDVPGDIVVPSGSCVSMIRNHYQELIGPDHSLKSEAENLAGRIFEFSEYLNKLVTNGEFFSKINSSALDKKLPDVVYHESCHLHRDLGVGDGPETILRNLPNINIVNLEQAEVCCGFGGTFAVKYAEISAAMMNEKVDLIEKSGADIVTSCDSSCLMNIDGGIRKRGLPVKAKHISELLDEVISESQEL